MDTKKSGKGPHDIDRVADFAARDYSNYGSRVRFDTGRLDTGYPGPGGSRDLERRFIFREHAILVPEGTGPVSFVSDPDTWRFPVTSRIFIGMLDSLPCYAESVSLSYEAPPGYVFSDLRELAGRLEDDILGAAGRASQVLLFDRNAQFCGRCGDQTELKTDELARICARCGTVAYPRLSPAVIVLVHRGDEVLLARSPRFPEGMYSVIAGFVEPGETIEHAIGREVMEETGIAIRDPVYFGSQPWPFPDSLMIGFTASYAGGSLRPDRNEIEDAGWFRFDALPGLPRPFSISRALIEWFVQNRAGRMRNGSGEESGTGPRSSEK